MDLEKIIRGDQQGPTKIEIPASIQLSCIGCDFHNQRMVRSGNDPIYRHDCSHLDAEEKPMKLSFTGNLPKDASTPQWCPFRKINQSTN